MYNFITIEGCIGAGKTTLLRHFNGLLVAESGTVTVCGRSVVADPIAARQQVGMVFQDADSQIVGETVYDDVAFGPENLSFGRQQIDQRVNQALAAVDLSGFENKMPHHLSGGEKRRLAIAGVLVWMTRLLARGGLPSAAFRYGNVAVEVSPLPPFFNKTINR